MCALRTVKCQGVKVSEKSSKFPKEELYDLTSQIRRAAFSVPLNIVEGHTSTSKKEFLNFLNIANRSFVETEYLLEIMNELKLLLGDDYKKLEKMRSEVTVMFNAFVKSVKNKL